MKVGFPNVADSIETLEFIRCFQDWAELNSSTNIVNLKAFFESLAKILAEAFEVPLVTIWDNNKYGDCLVLQASAPKSRQYLPHTIPIKRTITGVAVEEKKISYAEVENEILIAEGITQMISIPVYSPTDSEVVDLVINFYFKPNAKPAFPITEEDAIRLLSRFSTLLQNQIYKRDSEIERKVRNVAASAKGIPSLFDGIRKDIQKTTYCTYTELFSCDNSTKELELEGRFCLGEKEKSTLNSELFQEKNKKFLTQLKETCIEKKKPYVYLEDHYLSIPIRGKENLTTQCKYTAVPVLSSEDTVIGVLTCGNPAEEEERLAPSFSSFDVDALQTFSDALSPSIERLLVSRKESRMIKIISEVSDSMVTTYELNRNLSKAIETIVDTLHSEVGSVYLREGETDVFTMRAAKGNNEKLIDEASYKVGEGITGAVAQGDLLHFRSRDEMMNHPSYKGKYDEEIWGTKPDQRETFLGVPIIINNKIIGVLKVSNAIPTQSHPDSYYTDEDIQIGQVLSSFLAYAIQNYVQEGKRLAQFESLANTSLAIQSAANEEEAIISVLLNLATTEIRAVLLSIYDSQSKSIVGTQNLGDSWKEPLNQYLCYIDDDDIRARVLRNNKEEYGKLILENTKQPQKASEQLVIPLRLEDELIGTLQFDLGEYELNRRRELVLKAFASHLAITISRLRSIHQTIDLTNSIMVSARFITAETVSAMAIHSIHHKLVDLNSQIKKDLEKTNIRENRLLLETLEYWNQTIKKMEIELKDILNFVKAPSYGDKTKVRDVHPEIQVSISTWYNYARAKGCKFLPPRLDAKYSFCKITAQAFREILSVLIVNAVQAHAKNIEIKTYNETDTVVLHPDVIHSAFCLEFSDDGNGLATKNFEEIFEANYTTKPPNIGSGLGLFVARRLAHRAGGNLEVLDVQQNKGVAFRLILPFEEK